MENTNNSVRLTGFAGNDPEIRTFKEDKKMARLSMGIGKFNKNGTGTPQVQWFTLVFWNKKVELVEDLIQKGTKFSIEGKLINNSYTDKNNIKRYFTEIIVNTLAIA